MITFDEVRSMLSYDPDTGALTWLIRRGGAVRPGDDAARAFYSRGSRKYKRVTLQNRRYLAHRVAWLLAYGEWPSSEVDHINGNGQDNRACNLRLADHSQNLANRGRNANNTSGFKGVYWHRRARKWMAQIVVRGKVLYLGLHPDRYAAARAYDRAAIEHFGPFAARNFPARCLIAPGHAAEGVRISPSAANPSDLPAA